MVAETTAASLEDGVFEVQALGGEVLFGIEHEDAVFVDDADDHDDAHEAGDVEGLSGDCQGQEGAGGAEYGGDQDGEGVGEGAEFEDEDDEDEDDRHQQDLGEALEGFLLDLIEAAVFDFGAFGEF